MSDPPGGGWVSPFPPRVPMSDPNRPEPRARLSWGFMSPSLPQGRGPSSTQRFKSKSGGWVGVVVHIPRLKGWGGDSGKEGE